MNKEPIVPIESSKRLYQCPIPIVGLTGGIATGKSEASKSLLKKGFFIIDADRLVKEIYKSQEVINEMKASLPEFITKSNEINFKELRRSVFNDPCIKSQVENIIYPKMENAFNQHLSKLDNEKYQFNFIIYDAPLIFEKKLHTKLDYSVLISTTRETQINRVIQRDRVSSEEACRVIDSQMSLDDKKVLANITVFNDDSIQNFLKAIEETFYDLNKRFSSYKLN